MKQGIREELELAREDVVPAVLISHARVIFYVCELYVFVCTRV